MNSRAQAEKKNRFHLKFLFKSIKRIGVKRNVFTVV